MTLLFFHVSETPLEQSWAQSRHGFKEFQKLEKSQSHGFLNGLSFKSIVQIQKTSVFKWFELQKHHESLKLISF